MKQIFKPFLTKIVPVRTEEEWKNLVSLLPSWTMELYQFLPRQLDGKLTLKKHQQDKLLELLHNFKNGSHSFLADEMGLGKTLTVVTLLQHIYCNINFPPTLIVAPLTGKNVWIETLLKFSSLIIYRHWGGMNQMERDFSFYQVQQGKVAPHIWITTCEGLKSMMETDLKYMQWGILVIDETQKFKNPRLRYEALLQVQVRHRILISGTPLHNSPYELWPLLHILNPLLFPISSMKLYCTIVDNLKEAVQVIFCKIQNNLI
jgi:chromodomain-helicase-DNA-binding protein 7